MASLTFIGLSGISVAEGPRQSGADTNMDERRPYQPRPTPEQTQPLQGRSEGRESLQGPTTFDGHKPEAGSINPLIFRSRTLEGMKALRKEIEAAQVRADGAAEVCQGVKERHLAETGKVDLNAMLESLLEFKFGNPYYEKGLRDAFNLIAAHLHGKREWEGLKKDVILPKDTNPKK